MIFQRDDERRRRKREQELKITGEYLVLDNCNRQPSLFY